MSSPDCAEQPGNLTECSEEANQGCQITEGLSSLLGETFLTFFAVISGNHSYMAMFVRDCVGYTDENMFKCETVEVSLFLSLVI